MTTHYRLLDLCIDLPRQRVTRDGLPLDVGGLSFRLLAYLLAQGERVVGADELVEAVWAPAVVNEETVTQRVKLLRQALGDDARRPRYLRSVRGRGYQWVEAPVALPDVPAAPPGTAIPRRRSRRWIAVGSAALLGLGIAAVLAWRREHAPATAPVLARAAYYAGIGQADNNERAIALYRQALAQMPDSPAAIAGLSRALSARTCLYNGDAAQARQGLALARQLLRGDGEDAAAWSALGYAQDCLGDMPAAVEGYENALRRRPQDDGTRASLAYLYQEQGRLAEALRINLSLRDPARARFRDVQVARELELLGFLAAAERRHRSNFELFPDNVFSNMAWPHYLLARQRLDEASAALKQAATRGTPHPGLSQLQGELALLAGDRDGARRAFEAGARLRPHQSLPATLAGLYGAQPPAEAWLRSRLQGARGDVHGWPETQLEIALLEQARQRPDAALAALRAAVDAGLRDRAWLASTPLFEPLRHTPGFTALLAGIDRELRRQRALVEQADWRPPELR